MLSKSADSLLSERFPELVRPEAGRAPLMAPPAFEVQMLHDQKGRDWQPTAEVVTYRAGERYVIGQSLRDAFVLHLKVAVDVVEAAPVDLAPVADPVGPTETKVTAPAGRKVTRPAGKKG